MHPRVLVAVTTSLRSWNGYNAFEQMQRHFPKIGVSIVFNIWFIVLLLHLPCISRRFVYFCSQYSSSWVVVSSTTGWPAFLHPPLPYRVFNDYSRTQRVESSVGSASRVAAFSHPLF